MTKQAFFDPSKNLLPGLPVYSGGRMSDACYDAGAGLYARYNGGKPFECPANAEQVNKVLSQLLYLERCGYTLSAPIEYMTDPKQAHGMIYKLSYLERCCNTMSAAVRMEDFDCITCTNGQTDYTASQHHGLSTLVQTKASFPVPERTALLRTVTETEQGAFDAYLAQMVENGWSIVWKNRLEDNRFFALAKDKERIYAYFLEREGVARFVQDDFGTRIEEFGDNGSSSPVAGEPMQVCQFGLYCNYDVPGYSSDCGMFYIIKLPDHSLFLVDGGRREQATEAACAEIMRVMRKMSKTEEGEQIKIAGWFCTHAHEDHTDVFCKLLRIYHDQLDVRRVIFNFPADGVWGIKDVSSHILRERLNMYCPSAKYLKCHTGQSFELAGVRFEVLQTHEDGALITGEETIRYPGYGIDFNDSSTVLKISFKNASFLILGDVNKASEVQMLRHYSKETLHSTMMQVAHHMLNDLHDLYSIISPEVALVPRGVFFVIEMNPLFTNLLKSVSAQDMYFSGSATDIFQAEDGHFKLVERFPIEGYIYDGSLL